jgi:hypothetical protein
MLQFASDAQPRGSIVPLRGLRALGEEAPLRAALENGERLVVCASVRFADRTSSQPLWLTDRRFIFTHSQPRMGKALVSVPIAGSALDYESTDLYPLRLSWIGPDGSPSALSFRAHTWKDSVRSDGSAAAAGGATDGIAGAVIGLALGAAITGAVGTRGIASRDQKLHSILLATQRAPGQVRPVDLTAGSLNTSGGRWLIGGFMGVLSTLLLALAVFALVSYQAKQAYEAAPPCGSVAAGSDCRLLQPAVVTAYRGAGGKNAYCDLFLTTTEGSRVEADLHTFNLCAHDPRGQDMLVEYWRHALTGVIPPGAPTRVVPTEETGDNPEYNWRAGAIIAGLLGLLWVAFGSLALVVVIGWVKRRSLLRASAYAAGYLS